MSKAKFKFCTSIFLKFIYSNLFKLNLHWLCTKVFFRGLLCTNFPSLTESEVTQSCPTLCDPRDCNLSGSSVHAIFQARVLEWSAIAFSKYWNTFLNKCDYVIHHFNVHFLLCFLLMTYYLLFILYLFYIIEMMLESKFEWFFWVQNRL